MKQIDTETEDMQIPDEYKPTYIHEQHNSNCQQYFGPITGCIFAMPGATVNQHVGAGMAEPKEEDEPIIARLTPIFFGDEAEARKFLATIRGMKSTQITEVVNRLVADRKISDTSRHRDLWQILHDAGLYDKTESNWNGQVR